ncbi:MAG: sugar transferase [Pseudomonadota bacterium]
MLDRKSVRFQSLIETRKLFFGFKRAFDICVALLLVPVLAAWGTIIFTLNPFLNPGPLLYRQARMGRGCAPFFALKFRSMRPASAISRGADDPLETDRITVLGRFIRKSRIDELPQIINVLRGDMSLIGPRPDYFEHAAQFVEEVPGYRARHTVRPGISGLAQTELGYIEGISATRKKVAADHYYIENSGFAMDTWIVWRTLLVVAGRAGS